MYVSPYTRIVSCPYGFVKINNNNNRCVTNTFIDINPVNNCGYGRVFTTTFINNIPLQNHVEEVSIQELYDYYDFVNGQRIRRTLTPKFSIPSELYQIKDVIISKNYPPLFLRKDSSGKCNIHKYYPNHNTSGTYNQITNQITN